MRKNSDEHICSGCQSRPFHEPISLALVLDYIQVCTICTRLVSFIGRYLCRGLSIIIEFKNILSLLSQ